MEKTWVVVANGSEGRIFHINSLVKGLSLVSEHEHPQSRQKAGELITDRPGSYGAGTAHGSFVEAAEPKEVEMERFAQQLASVLNEGRNSNKFRRLVLVASPHFHGLLNKHIDNHTANLVWKHLDKDYTKVAERDLMSHLRDHLH